MSERTPKPTFIADAMLGRLAKSLRMLGFDTAYRPHIPDIELKRIALREKRVLLTRDHEVAETRLPVRVVLVESERPEKQLIQIVRELDLDVGPELFTRCLVCNVAVAEVSKAEVEHLVPAYVYSTQERFARCPSCGRIYWAATHVDHARDWLTAVLGTGAGRREPPDAEEEADGS
jgi:hypothetical protein